MDIWALGVCLFELLTLTKPFKLKNVESINHHKKLPLHKIDNEFYRKLIQDILIVDWMMPLMSGVDVCRQLRADIDTRHLPIIMLSARGEEGDRTLGLDNGADDYMSKPFSPRELVSRIKALLRRSKPSLIEQELHFQDLVLNTSTMVVTRYHVPITLGPKEFKILAILMERPGQVYSRVQLLDMVWGHGVYVEERTVDVHLSRLRKALSTVPGQREKLPDVIRTVRGSGYALVASAPF